MKNEEYLRDFLRRHGIRVKQEVELPFSKAFVLEQGIFDDEDEDTQSIIGLFSKSEIRYYSCNPTRGLVTRDWNEVKEYVKTKAYDIKDNEKNREASEREVRDLLKRNDISVFCEARYEFGTRFILEHCIFNPDHKRKDAMVFVYPDGEIAYKCFHDSCSRYNWKDVVALFEQDAHYCKEEEKSFPSESKYNDLDCPF